MVNALIVKRIASIIKEKKRTTLPVIEPYKPKMIKLVTNVMIRNQVLMNDNGFLVPGILLDSYIQKPFVLYDPGTYTHYRYEIAAFEILQERLIDEIAKVNPTEAVFKIVEIQEQVSEMKEYLKTIKPR